MLGGGVVPGSLVLLGGEARYGERDLATSLGLAERAGAPVLVDGAPRWLPRMLVERLQANGASEPGLEL